MRKSKIIYFSKISGSFMCEIEDDQEDITTKEQFFSNNDVYQMKAARKRLINENKKSWLKLSHIISFYCAISDSDSNSLRWFDRVWVYVGWL